MFRDGLIANVGECEHCGNHRTQLCVHEIAYGPNRQKALDQAYAVLVLCWPCNGGPFDNLSEWPEARQLALLARRRPMDFDLTAYLQLTSPQAMQRITIEEVLDFMEEEYLTKRDVADRMQVDRRSVQNWIDAGELRAIDCRTAGASRPLYRVAWSDYLEFCKARKVT